MNHILNFLSPLIATALIGLAPVDTVMTYAKARQPNIILVMTDDQGYGDFSCHGHPFLKTPNLDKLHAQSTRFTDFQVSPTCAPTRGALMAGKAPFKLGITHTILERDRMALSATTVAEVLRAAGYTTGIFGKWHLGDEDPYQPENRGFDEIFIHGAGGIGQRFPGTQADAPGTSYFDPIIKHNGTFVQTSGYCTDVFFQQTLAWIQSKQSSEQPFFAYLATNAPHAPFIVAEQYKQLFADKSDHKDVPAFLGMIVNIDENMGLLMEKLDQWGLSENTLLIYMTDNGTARGDTVFNAGMKGKKGHVSEGGTRVPLFMRLPGLTQPSMEINTLARHYDIFPTLADLAGAEVSPDLDLDGRSLLPLIRDPHAEWPDRKTYFHLARWSKAGAAGNWGKGNTSPDGAKYKNFAVRTERWRLKGYGTGDRASVSLSLHDVQKDLGQKHNVLKDYPEVAEALLDGYDRWWDKMRPFLINEEAALDVGKPFIKQFNKQKLTRGIPKWSAPKL